MTDLVQRLRDEAQRLSGHSIDRGSAEAGVASNLADAAADEIERLREAGKVALEEMRQTVAPRNSFTDAVDKLDAALNP